MQAMGLNTEGEGSAMAFLRRGYKVSHVCEGGGGGGALAWGEQVDDHACWVTNLQGCRHPAACRAHVPLHTPVPC